jgi:hypothetical protein
MSFEDIITRQNGIAVSRALVNVVIYQQVCQQINVCPCFLFLVLPHGLGLDEPMTSLRARTSLPLPRVRTLFPWIVNTPPELELTLTLSDAIFIAP